MGAVFFYAVLCPALSAAGGGTGRFFCARSLPAQGRTGGDAEEDRGQRTGCRGKAPFRRLGVVPLRCGYYLLYCISVELSTLRGKMRKQEDFVIPVDKC